MFINALSKEEYEEWISTAEMHDDPFEDYCNNRMLNAPNDIKYTYHCDVCGFDYYTDTPCSQH